MAQERPWGSFFGPPCFLKKRWASFLRLEVRTIAIAEGLGAKRKAWQHMSAGQGKPRSNDGTTRAGLSTIRHEYLHDNTWR